MRDIPEKFWLEPLFHMGLLAGVALSLMFAGLMIVLVSHAGV